MEEQGDRHLPEPQNRRIQIIAKPLAGGRRQSFCRAVVEALRQEGCRVSVRETAKRGDAECFARAASAADVDVLAVAGGDGMLNEVANGLTRTSPVLGIIPLGTANVLAAELGLPRSVAGVVDRLAHGQPAGIHTGRVNDRRFLIMAGIGFDAHVVCGVNPALKHWIGKGAYMAEMVRQFVRYPFVPYEVEIDGRRHAVSAIVVSKGRYYAGRYRLAPDARVDRPSLHACLFRSSGRRHVLRYALALGAGRLPSFRDVDLIEVTAVVVHGPAGEPVQADGDIVAHLPATIELDSEKLWVVR